MSNRRASGMQGQPVTGTTFLQKTSSLLTAQGSLYHAGYVSAAALLLDACTVTGCLQLPAQHCKLPWLAGSGVQGDTEAPCTCCPQLVQALPYCAWDCRCRNLVLVILIAYYSSWLAGRAAAVTSLLVPHCRPSACAAAGAAPDQQQLEHVRGSSPCLKLHQSK